MVSKTGEESGAQAMWGAAQPGARSEGETLLLSTATWKIGSGKVGVGLFSLVTSSRRESGLKLH